MSKYTFTSHLRILDTSKKSTLGQVRFLLNAVSAVKNPRSK